MKIASCINYQGNDSCDYKGKPTSSTRELTMLGDGMLRVEIHKLLALMAADEQE
jgi:hypothetical protein